MERAYSTIKGAKNVNYLPFVEFLGVENLGNAIFALIFDYQKVGRLSFLNDFSVNLINLWIVIPVRGEYDSMS